LGDVLHNLKLRGRPRPVAGGTPWAPSEEIKPAKRGGGGGGRGKPGGQRRSGGGGGGGRKPQGHGAPKSQGKPSGQRNRNRARRPKAA
jgi:ATP-dependent RNA helicase RhlE